MASFNYLVLQVSLLVFVISSFAGATSLSLNYYEKTCPQYEDIVKKTTARYIKNAPTLAAPILRMHFHDCFVRGCEGSVLLNATSSTNQTEKTAFPNLSLRGFQVIDGVKAALENKCPGVVSCADTLALVARDAVSLINGPFWNVPVGRRDGRVSIQSEAFTLPAPFANISSLITSFKAKGLSVKDLVVLSGGHTIGTSHCASFTNRLYNFTGKGDTDPSLDSNYIPHLKNKCSATDTTTHVEMDPGSFKTFDEDYYTLVAKRRGLFESDAALLNNAETKAYVKKQAAKTGHGATFAKDFAESMIKMGKIGVLTGNNGEIRKHCAFVN